MQVSSQQPHNLRTVMSAVTGLSEADIDVIVPDMGGGFGNKQHFLREEILVALLALMVPHPVVWIQDRTESLTSSVHSREQTHHVEVAYRNDGRILGLRVELLADLGSPTLYFTPAAPALVTTSMLTGTYAGASGEVSIAAGLGANVLVGGSHSTVALQPISVQGQTGLNIAAGVGALELHPLR